MAFLKGKRATGRGTSEKISSEILSRTKKLYVFPKTIYLDNWLIPSLEFDPEDYKLSKNSWQRKAPEEVNEIIKAVNAIARPRHRAILIMSIYHPKRYNQQSRHNDLALS